MCDFWAHEILDSEERRIAHRHNSETGGPHSGGGRAVERGKKPRIQIHADGPDQAAGENPFAEDPIFLEVGERFAEARMIALSVRPEPADHGDATDRSDDPKRAAGREQAETGEEKQAGDLTDGDGGIEEEGGEQAEARKADATSVLAQHDQGNDHGQRP